QLPDRTLTSELLDLFGRPRGESSCACERSDEAGLTQALQLIAGKNVQDRIQSPNNAIARLVQSTPDDAKLCEELYLRVLCRLPTTMERGIVAKHIAATGKAKRTDAAQDVAWALLNSREFLFNH